VLKKTERGYPTKTQRMILSDDKKKNAQGKDTGLGRRAKELRVHQGVKTVQILGGGGVQRKGERPTKLGQGYVRQSGTSKFKMS